MARSGGCFQVFEKLQGRENYAPWALDMQAILEIDETWCTIHPHSDDELSQEPAKIAKARAKMILSMARCTHSNIRATQGAKDLWDRLKAAYQTSGHNRRCGIMSVFS